MYRYMYSYPVDQLPFVSTLQAPVCRSTGTERYTGRATIFRIQARHATLVGCIIVGCPTMPGVEIGFLKLIRSNMIPTVLARLS